MEQQIDVSVSLPLSQINKYIYIFLKRERSQPWLPWLSWMSVVPVRMHAWVAGSIPGWGMWVAGRGAVLLLGVSLSNQCFSLSPPSPLYEINEHIFR